MTTERVNKLMAAQVAKLWRHVQKLERQVETLTVMADGRRK
jgi:hypothetical protein